MKKILLICTLLLTNLLFAKTITVDNNHATKQVAMFTDIEEAIEFATNGDIIMVKGSSTTYTINKLAKSLTFIGEGYKNTISTKNTQINLLNQSVEAKGSKFMSLILVINVNKGVLFSSGKVDNLTFINVKFNDIISLSGENWIVNNCVFTFNCNIKSYSITMNNCFFNNQLTGNQNLTGLSKLNNCTLSKDLKNIQSVEFNSCIFSLTQNVFLDSKNNTFNNCLFYSDVTNQTFIDMTSTASDCIYGKQPLFVNEIDYQLKDESPAKNTGIDGTDMGITGGAYPLLNLNGGNNLTVVDQVYVKTAVIRKTDALKLKVTAHQKQKGE